MASTSMDSHKVWPIPRRQDWSCWSIGLSFPPSNQALINSNPHRRVPYDRAEKEIGWM